MDMFENVKMARLKFCSNATSIVLYFEVTLKKIQTSSKFNSLSSQLFNTIKKTKFVFIN